MSDAPAVLQVLYFFVPAYLANISPVLVNRWFSAIAVPIDRGRSLWGKRLLGDHKTWRRLLAGIVTGVLAWWVPGSRDVVNGLDVVPPEEDNDDEITDAVRLVLEKDPFVNPDQIRVSTKNALVTLEGLVANDREKDMPEFDVWYVFGVDRVINALAVQA